ncbi:hypothetical protein [Naasia lichenicola]|uniref:Uncharacterized protein n=1 Tax=Naasia lichenicola TaxID=2565933 RepID=A0A4V3WTQ9_9MICO|nr:hypothetical protein [Naasia lichenicola]AGU10302.1 hypothetical protein [uncultured organism]THG32927.1 hypothetical protein E6C64_00700 [Naasia lichenicola]
MATIEEFLRSPSRFGIIARPDMDPLSEAHALDEASLIDIRFDAIRSTAWCIFDTRGALEITSGNTALIVATGVNYLRWDARTPIGKRTAWTIMEWNATIASNRIKMWGGLEPWCDFEIAADRAEFYVGDVPSADEPAPEMAYANEASIDAGFASFSSQFRPLQASMFNMDELVPDIL